MVGLALTKLQAVSNDTCISAPTPGQFEIGTHRCITNNADAACGMSGMDLQADVGCQVRQGVPAEFSPLATADLCL
jgi:hypothetical protein